MSLIDACAHISRPGAREQLDILVRTYRKCLYKYIRRHDKQPNDARDILQHFWKILLSGKLLARYRRENGPFHVFLFG